MHVDPGDKLSPVTVSSFSANLRPSSVMEYLQKERKGNHQLTSLQVITVSETDM